MHPKTKGISANIFYIISFIEIFYIIIYNLCKSQSKYIFFYLYCKYIYYNIQLKLQKEIKF